MKELVTIIVPVYNVQNYVKDCIQSIQSQTFKDFKCILVDDCSTDDSCSIIKGMIENDNRFNLIHKNKNEGLPAARMTGIKLVDTKYLMHVDSDDYLEIDALENLIKTQTQNNAKLVIGGFQRFYGLQKNTYIYDEEIKDVPLEFYCKKRISNLWSVWGKLYSTELFENIETPPFQNGEDQMFNIQILSRLKSEEISFCKKVIYNYRYNPASISSLAKRNKGISYKDSLNIKWCEWIRKYLMINGHDEILPDFIANVYLTGIITFLMNGGKINSKELADIKKDFVKKNYNRIIRKKDKLFLKCFFIFPKTISFIFSLRGRK